jgi:hypothetical protein
MKAAVSRIRGATVEIGKMIAGKASTSQILAIFEPMMLPCDESDDEECYRPAEHADLPCRSPASGAINRAGDIQAG